jgi:hypothetical protein
LRPITKVEIDNLYAGRQVFFKNFFLKLYSQVYSPAHAQGNLDRVRCQVLMINMVADNMVPIELGDARKVAERLKNATYLEVNEEAKYGMGRGGELLRCVGSEIAGVAEEGAARVTWRGRL